MEHLSGSSMNAAAEEIRKASQVPPPAMPEGFYVLLPPDGGPPHTPDDLKYCWQNASAGRAAMPGTHLGFAPERNPLLTIASDRIEARVPVELRPRDAEQGSAARGRLVFQLDDPAVLREVRKAHDDWRNEPRTGVPPGEIAGRGIPWKLLRLESNLKLEKPPTDRGGGGEGL